ncbi:class I SAM-dependent methyltransferase [Candidatus Woesearchaeota archaeon]|nr:class I SAM-dependent methyltransferase [Candidatus Woesearchaeota archaeon]
MEGIEDTTWSPDGLDILERFESYRNLVGRAARSLFSDFCMQHFTGRKRVVEVGAGTGFLGRNWPKEFNGQWIFVDGQQEFLKAGREKRAHGKFAVGSAYELPFGNESVDAVCGFASYDVLDDLGAAVEEAKRVLKPDGLFFHMSDMKANSQLLLKNLGYSLLPIEVHGIQSADCNTEEIFIVPFEKLHTYYEFMLQNRGHKYDSRRKASHFFRKLDSTSYFNAKLLEQLISKFGIENTSASKMKGTFKGARSEFQKGRYAPYGTFAGYDGEFRVRIGLKYRFYHAARILFGKAVQRFEPHIRETYAVYCAMARKNA